VVYSKTPQEDVARRDFTINGLLMRHDTGEVLDYVGGQEDLLARLVRAIGDPERRFTEDKLRMLRAIRFAARFRLRHRARHLRRHSGTRSGNSRRFSRARPRRIDQAPHRRRRAPWL